MTDEDIITGILLREGSVYTNDPADAGGPTKYGITLRDLRVFYTNPLLGEADVEALTEAEARLIYRTRYIHKPGFDTIRNDWQRAFIVDMGVLQGTRAAVMLVQRALRTIAVDGIFGPDTRDALDRADVDALRKNLITLRMQHLIACALADVPVNIKETTDLKWLKGWWNRVASFL